MISLFLAVLYIKNNLKQTIISSLGIALSISTLAIAIGIATGLGQNTIKNLLYFSPHIKVTSYTDEIADYQNVKQELINNHMTVYSECVGKGILKYNGFKGKYTDGVIINGLDKDYIDILIKDKKILGSLDNNQDILVGKELANELDLSLGETIKLISSENKEINLTVSGIFSFGYYDYDLNVVIIPLKTAQFLFNIEGINQLNIKVKDIYKAEEISKKISSSFNVRSKSWMASNTALLKGIMLEKQITILLLSLLILVTSFLTGSLISSIVRNKKKEIGILLAIGLSKMKIRNIFIIMSFILFLMGFIASIFIVVAVMSLLKFMTFNSIKEIYYIPDKIPFILSIKDYILVTSGSLITSLISSFIPARRAANLSPIDAIKSE